MAAEEILDGGRAFRPVMRDINMIGSSGIRFFCCPGVSVSPARVESLERGGGGLAFRGLLSG